MIKMSSEEEDYTACPNCQQVVPKHYEYCPHCGARLFRLGETPLLLLAGGIYFLNMILIVVLFSPFLLVVTMFEMGTAVLLISGRKAGGVLGILLSVFNPIFLLYYISVISFNYVALLLIIAHLAGAYLIIREWEKLA